MGYNEAKAIANTLHAQIGAAMKAKFNAVPAMSGVRTDKQGGLIYDFHPRINGWRCAVVILNWKDLYDIEIIRAVQDENGFSIEKKTEEDVYADQVVDVLGEMIR